jgi:hypothetical protein
MESDIITQLKTCTNSKYCTGQQHMALVGGRGRLRRPRSIPLVGQRGVATLPNQQQCTMCLPRTINSKYLLFGSRIFVYLLMAALMMSCGRSDTLGSTSYPPPQTDSPINNLVVTTVANEDYPAPPTAITPEVVVWSEHAGFVIGIVVNKDMKVLSVESQSGAEKARIQVGDVIESIENIPVAADTARAKTAIGQARADKKFILS